MSKGYDLVSPDQLLQRFLNPVDSKVPTCGTKGRTPVGG